MASQVSLPSTPQQNTSYDTYMQSLQQKLSSISMQNASTLLHVDSSAPTSGTATTEMLSPVQEFEAVPFPASPPPSVNETPKHSFKNLNNELTKINARMDTVEMSDAQIEAPEPPNQSEQSGNYEKCPPEKLEPKPVEKVRRVSRFKVSVVAEPDPSKLIIKPDVKPDVKPDLKPDLKPDEVTISSSSIIETTTTENALKQVPSLQDIPSILDNNLSEGHVELRDSVTLINNTMLQLQENIQTSYLSQAKSLIAAAPNGWTSENQPATIGNTAHVKIERKISMDNLKTRTTTTLKKSLSYNDLANEIANLFSKPSKQNKQNTIAGRVDPVVTCSNPRKISGNNRRMSKTFRRTPTIIIHPPDENSDRITNSCPNIHALIFKENGGVSTCQNAHGPPISAAKDELNHSCPDINVLVESHETYPKNITENNLSRSCPDINTITDVKSEVRFSNTSLTNLTNYEYNYQKYQPLNISFSECLNELDALKNEVNDIKKECECLLFGCSCDKTPAFQQRNQFKCTSKRKVSQKLLYKFLPNRPERKISLNKQDTYTRTVSEPNIFKNVKHSNYNFSEISAKKSPKKHEISPTELLKHKIKQSLSMYDLNTPVKHDDSYDNYVTIHGGMKFPKHLTDFTLNYDEASRDKPNDRELDKDNNLLAIVKCCCGLENCQNGRLQVVPITFQQLMDFNCEYNMNETFEDMLGRQQAELNALVEAHRKQQIEYMKSITDVSKNRKDS